MKKILSVLLAMAIIFSVMTTGVVNASAASIFDKAKTLDALEIVSIKNSTSADKDFYFKIKLSDSGKIKFHYESLSYTWGTQYFYLYDSSGNTIKSNYLSSSLEKDIEIPKKGTYYVRFKLVEKSSGREAGAINDLYYTFEPDNTPTIKICVYMDKGDTMNVAALASNYDGKVTWKTTKKAVATVSKGKIKAKSAGKARIRAYMDNGEYAEIVVIVKDED